MTDALLDIQGLVKHFGAVKATDEVDLDIRHGEIHALIGPNGAGKTTLVNQVSGFMAPDRGRIRFQGRDITRLAPYRRSLMGIARTFQVTSIFKSFSALDNVALAIQSQQGHSFRFWANARRVEALRTPAMDLLDRLGLANRADIPAGRLSHGEQRQIGVGMALATNPEILLLDEPTAGMGSSETAEMITMLNTLKGDHAVLLVEHDMDAVFSLADRISVLVYGRVIATGSPDVIKHHPQVREAYLGENWNNGSGAAFAAPPEEGSHALR